MAYTEKQDLVKASGGQFWGFRNAAAITPNNAADLAPYPRAIYVGGAGNIAIVPVEATDDTPVTFTAVPVGSVLHVQARRVMVTNTTATLLIALW